MKLHRIKVAHVRGLPAAEVHLGEGVTVIEAPNESGKTTLFDAFELLLREKHSTTKQEVRDLQPRGSDVGSLVEAELTLGATRLTVRKRFNRDRMTELRIHTPAPAQFTGDEAHAQLRALLEQHTDLPLLEALWFRQGRDLDCVELADSVSLARALDASAGGTGHAGDDALYDRIVAERDRYVTSTGKPRRLLLDAEEELDRLHQQVRELEDAEHALQDAAERVEALEAQRVDLNGRIDELTPRVTEHRERQGRIRQLRAELDAAVSRQDAARSDLDAARALRETRRELAATIDGLTGQLARERARSDDLSAQLAASADRVDAIEADVTEAEARESQIRADLAQARDAADLISRREDLRQCRESRERIDQIFADATAAAAFVDRHPSDPTLYATVADAAGEVQRLEAQLDQAAPRLRMRAIGPVTVRTTEGEVALDAGQQWEQQVSDAVHTQIADLVEVEVDPGSSLTQRRTQLTEARERLADACRALGVDDAAQADALDRERQHALQVITQRDEAFEREGGAERRDALDERVRILTVQVAELTTRLSGDEGQLALVADDAGTAVAELAAAETAARDTVVELRGKRRALATQLQQLRDAATEATTTLGHTARQLEDARQRLTAARTSLDDEALENRISAADKELQRATEAVAGARGELARLAPEATEDAVATVETQLTAAQERREVVRDELAGVRAAIEIKGGGGVGEALDHARVAHARQKDAYDSLQARADAAIALKEAFETARDEAYRSYRAPLRERVAGAARLVFGAEVDIELNERLAVTSRTLRGVTLPFDQLSAGAREQLAILTALAAADLAGQDDGGVPLVLDDMLGYSDPQRLERLGAVLGRMRGPQVIVLTCVGSRFQAVNGATLVRLREVTTPAG